MRGGIINQNPPDSYAITYDNFHTSCPQLNVEWFNLINSLIINLLKSANFCNDSTTTIVSMFFEDDTQYNVVYGEFFTSDITGEYALFYVFDMQDNECQLVYLELDNLQGRDKLSHRLYKCSDVDEAEYQVGVEVETEHHDTIKYIKEHPDVSYEDAYAMIAEDHLREHPDYYDDTIGLPAMERNLEKS